MPKEVEVQIWCDQCLKMKVRIPGEAVKVEVGGATLLDLDLCEKHKRSMIRSVKKALPKVYSPRAKRHRNDRTSGPFKCQVPDCPSQPLRHRSSLWQHIRGWHQLDMKGYVALYGELVPLTPAEQKAFVGEVSCDECGETYSTATGTRWPYQALISHMRGRHAIKLTTTGEKVPIA